MGDLVSNLVEQSQLLGMPANMEPIFPLLRLSRRQRVGLEGKMVGKPTAGAPRGGARVEVVMGSVTVKPERILGLRIDLVMEWLGLRAVSTDVVVCNRIP